MFYICRGWQWLFKAAGRFRKPGSHICGVPRDPRALFYRVFCSLAEESPSKHSFIFPLPHVCCSLLGSWVVFVFRNVSVESATRQNEEKNIQKIDCFFCFLRFKENKIHHMLLGGRKLLYTFGQQNSFVYMELGSSFPQVKDIFEKVKYFFQKSCWASKEENRLLCSALW